MTYFSYSAHGYVSCYYCFFLLLLTFIFLFTFFLSFFFFLLPFHLFLFVSELVLKVRIANTDDPDFIEIDFPITHMNFSQLLTVCCKELAVNPQMVERIRYTQCLLSRS